MALEKITVISDERNIYQVKNVLDAFNNALNSIEISRPKFGKLSDFILVTFKVPEDILKMVLEKLLLNDIRVLETKKNQGLLHSLQNHLYNEKKKKVKGHGWNDINKAKKSNITLGDLELLSAQGKYEEVLKVSRDLIKYGTAMVEKAKIMLAETALIAIDLAQADGFASEEKAEKSLKILLGIAADNTLKSMQKMDIVKQAGLTAVDICAIYFEMIYELVKISNHNKLHNYVNVKSAAKFSEIVFADEEKYHDHLTDAIRNLNINWLMIAFDVVHSDLSSDEINQFNRITSFVKETRTL